MSNTLTTALSIVSLVILIVALAFVFLYAIFSKPNEKKKKSYSRSIIANGNGIIGFGHYSTCVTSRIMNGSENRNTGTRVSELYDAIAIRKISLNYLKQKSQL